jgi:hypothetical protein
MKNKKRSPSIMMVLVSLLLILIFAAWLIWVVTYNHKLKSRDLVPIENYPMNTFVDLGNNYCYGDYYDGVSICANNYKIMDTDAYLQEKGLSEDDFGYLTDRICIVDINVRYRATEEQKDEAQNNEAQKDDVQANEAQRNEALMVGEPYMDVNMGAFFICGQDYYNGQNTELYYEENPYANGTMGIRFYDGDECNVRLVFNLDKRYFTEYSWNHIEDLPRMLYLTGMPVQKNIILHK